MIMDEAAIKKSLEKGFQLHMGIAEQGKLYALEGNHKLALLYYQTAISMTIKAKDPEIFFRHYLECSLESMEHLGMLEEVLEYCDRALNLYAETPPPNEFARMDFVYIHQKKAIALMKLDKKEEAIVFFKKAIELAKAEKTKLPLSNTLMRWLTIGYFIEPSRISGEQYKEAYFNVRKDTVDPTKAIKLPDEDLLPV